MYHDLFERAEREATRTIIQSMPEMFMPGFESYMEERWAAWKMFEHEAQRMVFRGHVPYSARTIVEWVRHEAVLRSDPKLSIDQAATASFARLFVIRHPQWHELFDLRERGLRKPVPAEAAVETQDYNGSQ